MLQNASEHISDLGLIANLKKLVMSGARVTTTEVTVEFEQESLQEKYAVF